MKRAKSDWSFKITFLAVGKKLALLIFHSLEIIEGSAGCWCCCILTVLIPSMWEQHTHLMPVCGNLQWSHFYSLPTFRGGMTEIIASEMHDSLMLLFSLCFFSAVAQKRKNHGALNWKIPCIYLSWRQCSAAVWLSTKQSVGFTEGDILIAVRETHFFLATFWYEDMDVSLSCSL